MNELGLYRKGPFGSSLTKSMFVPKSVSTIKVYEQKNAIQKDYRLGDYYISQDKYKSMKSFIVQPNDIIVSCAGTIGETYVLPKEAPIGIINQALMRVCLYYLPLSEFWQMYFDYVLMKEAKMKGAGSAIKNIPPFEYLKAILVPLPPEAEQKKIVVRYFELLQKVTCFDKLRVDKEQLNSSIYAKLKQSFLQEAIQGKLVEQDPSDEPAVKLLERIREEKQELVKQGKLKKSELNDSVIFKGEDNKYYEKIGSDVLEIELPFPYPESWQMVRLRTICQLVEGQKQVGNKICLDAKYLRGKTKGTMLVQGKFVGKGQNIILVDGENSGEVFVTPIEGYMGSTFKQLWISEILYIPYVLLFIHYYKDKLRNSKKGAAIPHLNKVIFYNLIVGLPPFEEQKRISEKYNELLQFLK